MFSLFLRYADLRLIFMQTWLKGALCFPLLIIIFYFRFLNMLVPFMSNTIYPRFCQSANGLFGCKKNFEAQLS